jgi:hypothetical protein
VILKYSADIVKNYLKYDNKDYQHYLKWCQNVVILSKELGKIRFSPTLWYDAQKIMAYYIFKAISDPDLKTIVILKSRQMGATTFLKPFDIYYTMRFKGIRGAIVAHDEETIEEIRNDIRHYIYPSLPPQYKRPIVRHNRWRTTFAFEGGGANNSSIYYYHPKSRNKKAGNMGRGQATIFAHLTEVAYYPNVDDINNFEATFSETHDKRLYIYESTANGYNHFYDLWEAAKESNTIGALFLGWWLKDSYKVTNEKDLLMYGYDPDEDEKERIDLVKSIYGYEITIEQLAWWRKHYKEHAKESVDTNKSKLDNMLEMYPFTEFDAFRTSGKQYFLPNKVKESYDKVKQPVLTLQPIFYEKPEKTKLVKSVSGKIKIWEDPPDLNYNGYLLSFDPAYSTNPDSDNSCIQVWKCFRDKMIQVLEFASPTIETLKSAWLFLKIGSMFNCSLSIYEIDGAGKAVAEMIEFLRKQTIENIGDGDRTIYEYARRMKQYLYRRIDSLAGGTALQWITGGNKLKIMSQLRGVFHDGLLEVNSIELLKELEFIVKDGGDIAAIKGKHDDRVMTAAFAVEAWLNQMAFRLPTYDEYIESLNKPKIHNEKSDAITAFTTNLINKTISLAMVENEE